MPRTKKKSTLPKEMTKAEVRNMTRQLKGILPDHWVRDVGVAPAKPQTIKIPKN